MKDLKKLVFAAALLLSLVGGASTASADPGKPGTGTTITITSTTGVTWEDSSGGTFLSAGVTWEE
jgi:ABC-type proline/glycine betaine transport system substrate-binding protein